MKLQRYNFSPLWLLICVPFAMAQAVQVDEQLQVSREILDVRVLDVGGNPILGLGTEDFQLKIEGKKVPIDTADWIDPTRQDLSKLKVAPGQKFEQTDEAFWASNQLSREAEAEGRLITLFVQTELTGSRMSSYLRMPRYIKVFFDQLDEKDYVAVYGFGSHLTLYCDFTQDREIAQQAVQLAVRRSDEVAFMAAEPPSLGPYYNESEALDIAKPEDALAHIGENLAAFPGNKTLIYLGYGFGRFSGGNVYMEPEYKRAVLALNSARTNVFSVDITRADYHPLEQGMRRIAEDTGGTYYSARVFPENAVRRVANAISGYYRVSFQFPEDMEDNPKFRLQLKNGKGSLFVRNPYNGAPAIN